MNNENPYAVEGQEPLTGVKPSWVCRVFGGLILIVGGCFFVLGILLLCLLLDVIQPQGWNMSDNDFKGGAMIYLGIGVSWIIAGSLVRHSRWLIGLFVLASGPLAVSYIAFILFNSHGR